MNSALLTIDDIPSQNTPAIVDYLREKGIQAILFAEGRRIEQYYEEAVYALKSGMIVGNHSYSHEHFSNMELEECIADIEKCEKLLDQLYRDSGVKRVYRPFRFPYGDKGGKNKDALQQYFQEKGFDKVDDRHLPYPWWRESHLATDVDTFWSFDFEEYRVQWDSDFTKETIWQKMHDPAPVRGGALFGPEQRNILLMHAQDATEEKLPGYYRLFLDHMLEHGVTFDVPAFIGKE